MTRGQRLDDLLGHLVRTTSLRAGTAGRLVEEFVARRHRELQAEGLRNDEIFARIADEICARRFAAPQLTERQIRRLIYG